MAITLKSLPGRLLSPFCLALFLKFYFTVSLEYIPLSLHFVWPSVCFCVLGQIGPFVLKERPHVESILRRLVVQGLQSPEPGCPDV